MLFSVVVPVYNVEDYLNECVQSVLNQTFMDFEIILVDDGSTDSSPAICDNFANQYPDLIKVHHKKNEGLLLTRRKGFKLASGEYILSLDSDDMLRNDAMEVLFNEIQHCKPDVIVFDFSLDKEYKIKKSNIPFDCGQPIDKIMIYETICSGSGFNNLANKCIKRNLININYDYSNFKFLSNGEDLLQLLPIIDKAEHIEYINQNLYYYRTNESSITHAFSENYFRSVSIVGYELRKYMEKWSFDKSRVYTRNIYTCINAFKYVLNSDIGLGEKYKHIKDIAMSDFFKSSYKNCSISMLTLKQKIITCILLVLSL